MNVNQKKHIVLVNINRVVNAKGGMEKVFCEMANALNRKGYRVTAICCEPIQGKPGYLIDKEVRFLNAYKPSFISFVYKNPFRNLRCISFNKKKRHLKRALLNHEWQRRSIKETLQNIPKADLFISYQAETTFILKDNLNIQEPIITMFHCSPMVEFNTITFPLYKKSIEQCAAVQVLMPEYIDVARKTLSTVPIIHIPNFVPQCTAEPNYSAKKIIVVARVTNGKRPILLLEAMGLLKKEFPDWSCEWWGEDDQDIKLTRQIKTIIKNKKLENKFFLKGATNNIFEKLQDASIFALPSKSEGFGLALTEALSIGLPAIACKDCSALNTLIQNGSNGLLTESTPEFFAAGLAKLMRNQELRKKLGQQGKRDMKIYSPDVIWDKWDQLIQSILNKK